jgi:hypothetical protein
MPDDARSIFRREALRHFIEGREKSVLPRFIRPRTFLCLWILLGLLMLAAVLAWTARVPVYASGLAVVTKTEGQVNLVVLVPAESFEKLRVGQVVWVRWPAAREPVRTVLTHVEPEIQSPALVRKRFGLSSETVSGAVAVATASPEGVLDTTGDLPPETRLGSTVSVDVEIGSRRALSLLPVLGEVLR